MREGSAHEKSPQLLEAFLAEQARHVAVPDKAKELHNPVPYSEQVIEEARSHLGRSLRVLPRE